MDGTPKRIEIIRVRLGKFEWMLLLWIGLLGFLSIPPGTFRVLQDEPIADLYNSYTKEHFGVLMKIDPEHHFPNGTVEEGWLIRTEHAGDTWVPAANQKRVIRVNR